jgi:hypothetical protein
MARSLTSRGARVALVLGPLVVAALSTLAPSADAAIAQVQIGTLKSTNSGTSVAPTLPAASTTGTLLVVVLTSDAASSSSGPAGWTRAVSIFQSTNGWAEIWYRPNNPGGITSATFTIPSAASVEAEMSEWSGVATSSPVDTTSTVTATGTTSATVSATNSASGDLGITGFTVKNGVTTFTAGSGWTHLFTDTSIKESVGDYKLGLASGSVSETETANSSNSWAGAIATFKSAAGACSGGSLALTLPGSVTFGNLTLNGTNQTTTASPVLTPDDETGSGAGWNITGTSTTLTNAGGKTLPTTATTATGSSAAAATGNCVLPTNSIGYPVTLPAGGSPPTAVKLYNAAANTGEGPTDVTFNFQLALPANAYIGTYTSTWTFAIVSGP